MQGPNGVGKTHLAYAIAARAMELRHAVFAHTVPETLNLLSSGFDDKTYESWLDGLKSVELLVLDDLGAQRETNWTNEQLFMIIDRRYVLGRPTVFTTNEDIESPNCQIPQRILSRLSDGTRAKGGMVRIVRFPVGDFRPTRKAPVGQLNGE
jgi:DNA replication protein DnaC